MENKQLISRLTIFSESSSFDPEIKKVLGQFIQCIEAEKNEKEQNDTADALRKALRKAFERTDDFPRIRMEEYFELELFLARHCPKNDKNEVTKKLIDPLMLMDFEGDPEDETQYIALPSTGKLYPRETLVGHFGSLGGYRVNEGGRPQDEHRNILNEWDIRHLKRNGISFLTWEDIVRLRTMAAFSQTEDMGEVHDLLGQEIIYAVIQATSGRGQGRLMGLILGIMTGGVAAYMGLVLLVPPMWIATNIVIALTAFAAGALSVLKRRQNEDRQTSRFSQFVTGVVNVLAAEVMAITLLSAFANGVIFLLAGTAVVSTSASVSLAAVLHLCQPIIAGTVFGVAALAETFRHNGLKTVCEFIFYTPIKKTIFAFAKIGAGIGQLLDACLSAGLPAAPDGIPAPPVFPDNGNNNRGIMNRLGNHSEMQPGQRQLSPVIQDAVVSEVQPEPVPVFSQNRDDAEHFQNVLSLQGLRP